LHVLTSIASVGLAEQPYGQLAHLAEDAIGVQNPRGDALALTHETEEQVLGADMVMAERLRLVDGQGEHFAHARHKLDLALGCAVAPTDDGSDSIPYLIQLDPQPAQHLGSDAFFFAEQSEEEVLCPDVVMILNLSFANVQR
jgi:hypothetical protein